MWGGGAEPIDQRSRNLLGGTRLLQYNRRQLPVLRVARSKDRLDLRDRVALRCQGGATIIDLANPLAAVCRSMIREGGLPVIGLCEQWAFTKRFFARVLNADPDSLELLSVGTNHLTWALGLEHEGSLLD